MVRGGCEVDATKANRCESKSKRMLRTDNRRSLNTESPMAAHSLNS